MAIIYPALTERNYHFFRLFGGGLGNLLFPWARAVVAARLHSLPIIYPTWLQLKIGPYLRGELDKRHYSKLFRPNDKYITGTTALKSRLLPVISEEDFFCSPKQYSEKNCLVKFQGYSGYFDAIMDNHQLVFSELLSIASEFSIKNVIDRDFGAVHVRLGDFKVGQQTTSPDFYRLALKQITSHRSDLSILVFSDGEISEVRQIIGESITSYEYVNTGNALADLLSMSGSRYLVASANSTFSWWASYLGRMPTIWPKTTSTTSILSGNEGPELYLSPGADIPRLFFERVDIRP